MRAQMRYADALGARAALIIGERELARGVAALKPLDHPGEQVEIALEAAAVLSAVSAD
jgi:histidyl-tRNA synthetase